MIFQGGSGPPVPSSESALGVWQYIKKERKNLNETFFLEKALLGNEKHSDVNPLFQKFREISREITCAV